jgi:hypothetical protein
VIIDLIRFIWISPLSASSVTIWSLRSRLRYLPVDDCSRVRRIDRTFEEITVFNLAEPYLKPKPQTDLFPLGSCEGQKYLAASLSEMLFVYVYTQAFFATSLHKGSCGFLTTFPEGGATIHISSPLGRELLCLFIAT